MANFSCSDYGLSRTNITEEEWDLEFLTHSDNASITALAVCQLMVSVVGTVWNTIILSILLKKKMFKDPTYALLINLVVADLLVCALVLPFNIESSFNREFTLGLSDYVRCRSCHVVGVSLLSFIQVSSFTLAALSVDRLLFIKRPFTYKRYVSVKSVLIVILVLWLLAFAVNLPPVLGFGEVKLIDKLSVCVAQVYDHGLFIDNVFNYIFLVIVRFVPYFVSLVANLWIISIACKHGNSNRQKQQSTARQAELGSAIEDQQNRSHSLHEKIRLAKIFGAIFIADVMLWIPLIATTPIQIALKEDVPIAVYIVLYVSVISQSAVHPVLETCVLGKATKVIYHSLCCCIENCKAQDSSQFKHAHNKRS